MSRDSYFHRAIEDARFSFTARPEPVAGDLRMSWGIGILLLSLLHSHGKRGTFEKLQFLAHSVRTHEGREEVRELLARRLRATEVSVRVEPWLNRAVSYAHGLGLVEVSNGRSVKLTQKGKEVAAAIEADEDVFREERSFLADVSKMLTQAQLTRIWRMEDLL